MQVNITPALANPIPVSISGVPSRTAHGTSVTASASVGNGTGNVTYVWYLNGESKFTGASYTFGSDLTAGYYRLDVTAYTADGSAGSASVSMTASSVPSQGLVAYYPFDGNAINASGHGNNGTVVGAIPAADRFGNAGKAYNFNGRSYIDIPDTLSLNPTQALSVAAWFYLRSMACSYPPLVKKSDITQSHGYALEGHINPNGLDGVYGPAVLFIVDTNGGQGLSPICAASITLNV